MPRYLVSFHCETCSTTIHILLTVHKSPLQVPSSFVHSVPRRHEGHSQKHFTPHGAVSDFLSSHVNVLSSANQGQVNVKYFYRPLCFYTCLSFCPRVGCLVRGVPGPGGGPGLGRVWRPPPWRLLPRAERILLECILILMYIYTCMCSMKDAHFRHCATDSLLLCFTLIALMIWWHVKLLWPSCNCICNHRSNTWCW